MRVGVHFTIDTENQPALFRGVWCTPRVGHGAFDDEMVLRRDVRDIGNLNLFPNNVIGKELNYYLTKQNPYGLPLDSRKEYTKSDLIMWTAAMSSDKETFQKFSDPVYKYINETVSRVPISDWHHTDSGRWVGFRARSVIGGYWMKVLMDKVQNNQ